MAIPTHPTPQQNLILALAERNVDGVRQALADGANPNVGPLGETTYHPLERTCVRAGHFEKGIASLRCASLMLLAGADPTRTASGNPHKILIDAIENGTREHDRVIDVLIKHWPKDKVSWQSSLKEGDGQTLLHLAVKRGREQPIVLLARHGMAIDTPDVLGNTPLMLASGAQTAGALLALGADPHHLNHKRQTLLWLAVGSPQQGVRDAVIHALLDLEIDLEREPRIAELGRRVKRKIEALSREANKSDYAALKRLETYLRRRTLGNKATKISAGREQGGQTKRQM